MVASGHEQRYRRQLCLRFRNQKRTVEDARVREAERERCEERVLSRTAKAPPAGDVAHGAAFFVPGQAIREYRNKSHRLVFSGL